MNLIDGEGMKYIEEFWYKRKVKLGVRERFCYVIKCMGNVKDSRVKRSVFQYGWVFIKVKLM